MELRAEYDILLVTDNLVIIADRGTGGRPIAEDAKRVATRLANEVGRLTRRRRVYFRGTDGRFREICFMLNEYKGVRLCTDSQQFFITALLNNGVVEASG